ncbi:MAG: hydroxymethylbilane synthase [Legionellales bacterium RIFCSPHIGHO2_12_FULL_35_11]|nr:MAG: hydroxymethylbilane synthase [Legionellales bacterium RIFCSPHIGHO2_12_FULL_35_11]
MVKKLIRIATRKSPLALWQAEHIANRLKKHWPDIETKLIPLQTTGDINLKDKLQSIGGKGLFIKELEIALLKNEADIAVHSMKDVPAILPEVLTLPVICKRDNPFDALVSKKYSKLSDFPKGAIIGTSSLRRQSQIKKFRPDLEIKVLRGNINTRLAKLAKDEFDGILLAASGLIRMNLESEISEILQPEIMLPACGQGALGIEIRQNDLDIKKYISTLQDDITALCVITERYINGKLGGSCHTPIGIFCETTPNSGISIKVRILSPSGEEEISAETIGNISKSQSLADECIDILMNKGAKKLLSTEWI